LVVPKKLIVVDVDDKAEGALIWDILKLAKVGHHAIRTPNGWQFIFKDEGTVSRQVTKALTLAGFIVDYCLQGLYHLASDYLIWIEARRRECKN
jgi:putative DNA primase/helicase